MIVSPAIEIESPPWTARPYGLFSVVDFTEDAGPSRWINGARFEQTSCTDIGLYSSEPCAPEPEPDPDDPDPAPVPPLREKWQTCDYGEAVSAFTVYSGSYQSGRLESAQARAVADLLRKEQVAAEHALWVSGLSSHALPDVATTVTGTPGSVGEAVALLEAYAASEFGGVGVIHIGTYLGSLLAKDLVRQGQTLATPLGTPVVVGAGYSSDEEETLPIYVTPQLVGRRSTVHVLQAFAAGSNDVETYAEREYLIGYEDCGVGVVNLSGSSSAPAYIKIGA